MVVLFFFFINFLIPYLGQILYIYFSTKVLSPNKVGTKFQLHGYPSIILFICWFLFTVHSSLIFFSLLF